MSVEPYTDAELLALGLPLTEDERQEQLGDLRTQALELEAKGALLAGPLRQKRDGRAMRNVWLLSILLKRLGFAPSQEN